MTVSLPNLRVSFFIFFSLNRVAFFSGMAQKRFDTENGFNMSPLMYAKSSAK